MVTRAGSRWSTTELSGDSPGELYGGWPMILSGVEDVARDLPDPDHPGFTDVRRALNRPNGGIDATDAHNRTCQHDRGQRHRSGRSHGVLCRRPWLREAARRPDEPDHALDRGRTAGANTSIGLNLNDGDPGLPTDTGVRFTVPDAEAEQEAMRADVGANVGAVLRLDGVPPMFTFDDPDGNRFYVIEESR